MGNLRFKDIYLGKIDAYNEYLEYGQDIFKNIFFEYPNFDLAKVLDGSVYYICGDKGSGKTMLLKYVESIIYENKEVNFTEFIRFKKDVDEDQRNQIKRASIPTQSFEEIIEREIPSDISIDCVLAWQVYLIKVVVNRLMKTACGIFDRNDDNFLALTNLLNAIYDESKEASSIKKIIPKVKKGNIEINLAKYGKLKLDLEWDDIEKKSVPFNTIAKRVVDLYSSLKTVDGAKIYILIDELELSLRHKKQYIRDITLIRDLIFAVQYLSEISKMHCYNVYFIASIRNEIHKEAAAKGFEINKPIRDFGSHIDWSQKGGNIKEHPLLKMLQKRIEYSESISNCRSDHDVWDEYFLQHVGRNNISIFNYILDQTWYRPRDIIRLFSIISEKHGNKNFADQEVFDGIRQTYSEEAWGEFEEVLTAKYSDKEVIGIRHALTGLSLPFSVKDFESQISGKIETFSEIEELQKNRRKPQQILRDLYDIGVIGNFGDFPRFVFRGDVDINPIAPLTIHYPLIRFFKASIRRRETHTY